jgi:hypothetical protein
MLLSGTWSPPSPSPGTPALAASRVVHAFESENCEVARTSPYTYQVLVPGLDMKMEQWLPISLLRPLCRPFWDQMEVRVESDGSIRYQAHYGSSVQIALHAALVLAGAWELSGGDLDPARVLLWLLLNAVPVALTVATLARCRARVFRRLAG